MKKTTRRPGTDVARKKAVSPPRPDRSSLLGTWHIIHGDDFDSDFLNLVEQAYLSLTPRGGKIAFGAMEAVLQRIPGQQKDGANLINWQGVEEGDQISGSGVLKLRKDGKLEITIAYHLGDEYSFVAERARQR